MLYLQGDTEGPCPPTVTRLLRLPVKLLLRLGKASRSSISQRMASIPSCTATSWRRILTSAERSQLCMNSAELDKHDAGANTGSDVCALQVWGEPREVCMFTAVLNLSQELLDKTYSAPLSSETPTSVLI